MEDGQKKTLNMERLRERLKGESGQRYWKSLEEVADTEEFKQWVDDEFPHRGSLLEINRRDLLKFMGASMAMAGLGGCRALVMDKEKVIPYVKQPEEMVPGRPLYFRTAMSGPGYAVGLEVASREGRPIKVEGNPDHSASLGASDPFAQASLLNLYDPDRSINVTLKGEIETWEAYIEALQESVRKSGAGGSGFRVLTETVTSPTLRRQIGQLQNAYPAMGWHQWQPLNRSAAFEGARMAFGRPLQTVYDLTKAKIILLIDAEFVGGQMPGGLRYARQMMDGRRVEDTHGEMNRIYSVHVSPTATTVSADHSEPMTIAQIQNLLFELAPPDGSTFGLGVRQPGQGVPFNSAVAADMAAHQGECVIVVGDQMPAAVHAMAHLLNSRLGNIGKTVSYIEPVEAEIGDQYASLKQLTDDIAAGQVHTLLILNANPAYNAPSDIPFAATLKDALTAGKLKGAFHYGQYVDETALLCDWHANATHYLESWSDERAFDGTVSIVQPLIEPMYQARTAHELIALLLKKPQLPYDIVRDTWKSQLNDKAWRKALHDGIIVDSPRAPLKNLGQVQRDVTPARTGGFEIHFRPDPTIGDGAMANNGWLQELPKPITKIVWDNVVHMSPRTAQDLGVHNESHVKITVAGKSVIAPVWIVPGHANESATVFLGYGRKAGGVLTTAEDGKPRGYDAYSIQQSASPWVAEGQLEKVEGTTVIAVTQDHNSMEGRDIIRAGTLDEYKSNPAFHPHPGEDHGKPEDLTLYNLTNEWEKENPDLPQWGMSIDLNTCIGCNACVTACQAENNIAVVGKEQVTRGREMHWIRIDRYYGPRDGEGDLDNPVTLFQPLTCMHCENAPCEPVCPVGATVHSHEGLNQMVYNRCVGTRYCSNNCPYKVRRFNFLNFQHLQPNYKKDKDIPLLRLINNPEVTVRSRGVMEKCTYCVQRINAARIEAKKESRKIKDGEVVTACQQACPTRAIVFGDITDKNSQVFRLKAEKRTYMLLQELNTFPRTTYLGKIRNPNPALEPAKQSHSEAEAH